MQYQQYVRRAAVICITSGFSIVSAFAGGLGNPNLPNFHMIDAHVYRGAQPTDDGFKELAKQGIQTIVDLREIGEHSQAQEEKVVTGLGMRYISVPMKGMSTPNDNQVANVLALLKDSTTGPVFVHCKRGADRTGMVIAVYRISHDGWDNKTALHEAKSDGMSIFERALQHYVSDYKSIAVPANSPTVAEVRTAAAE